MWFLLLLYWIATSPIFDAVAGVIILGVVTLLIVNARNKKRATREFQEKIVRQLKENEAARHSLITQRYEPAIAERILSHEIWQGMTAEQLMDSAGTAEAVDTIVTKTKRKEIWKYYQETATRFGMRVTLEDGVVVGWTQR